MSSAGLRAGGILQRATSTITYSAAARRAACAAGSACVNPPAAWLHTAASPPQRARQYTQLHISAAPLSELAACDGRGCGSRRRLPEMQPRRAGSGGSPPWSTAGAAVCGRALSSEARKQWVRQPCTLSNEGLMVSSELV